VEVSTSRPLDEAIWPANQRNSNRRLDNNFNIFEGLSKNYYFMGISVVMCGGQALIVQFGGVPFDIAPEGQTAVMWGFAIVLGFLSIPVGVIIRLVPDSLVEQLIPESLKRRSRRTNVPGVTVSDDEERFQDYPLAFSEVRDELAWLKRVKGGRLNNLKFTMKHPKEAFMAKIKSPSHSRSHSRDHSRSGSIQAPRTPTREDSMGSAAPTPDSRKRSRSMRSRSNSALGAPTVMAGIIAGSVAAGWSPVERGDRDTSPMPRPFGSSLSRNNSANGGSLGEYTEEPEEIQAEGSHNNVPKLSVPEPRKSMS
jgi:P-type Ca2+ transporter type 2C